MKNPKHTMRWATPMFMILMCISTGCSPRLNDQRIIEIDAFEITSITLDAISGEQTINVVAKSDATPIDLHIYLSEDEESVERDITFSSETTKIIASQLKSQNISLSAPIPAGQEAVIRFQNTESKPTSITVTLSN